MSALYNEIDPFAAAWLSRLASAGHVAPGRVETRSIRALAPEDVRDAVQFHAFAGIGGWSYALRLAGWPFDRPAWTGSCPCQPWSSAGKQGGESDERHLWPEFFRLLRECRPPVLFMEQVASPAGLRWLDAVYADLEGAGYAVGAADLCAASVGAPHARQRLYIGAVRVDHTDRHGQHEREHTRVVAGAASAQPEHRGEDVGQGSMRPGPARGVAHPAGERREQARRDASRDPAANRSRPGDRVGDAVPDGGVVDAAGRGARPAEQPGCVPGAQLAGERGGSSARGLLDPWRDCDWIACLDGKSRQVEPGTFPLAHGIPSRVGRLRGYGNAIVPPVAAAFVRAFLAAAGDLDADA